MNGIFDIYIGGQQLEGFTSASLTREKENLTGNLNVTVFFGYVPNQPLIRQAVAGAEVIVQVAGQTVFTGEVDSRNGKGLKNQDTSAESSKTSASSSIGPDSYEVTISARGKTKVLVDSSHKHETTNLLKPTDKKVVEELLANHEIALDWQGEIVDLDKVRLRDGSPIIEELRRVAAENAHYIYEDKDGKLRVTDGPVGTGDPIILGENILTFSAEQTQEFSKSEIEVKGHFINKEKRGIEKVKDRIVKITDRWVKSNVPLVIQHYGNGTDEELERRGRFEADKRTQDAKNVTVTVFHVQSQSGAIWDIGTEHYVEVPPEGLFESMECIRVVYNVDKEKLTTTLTLAPPPQKNVSGSKTAASGLGVASGNTFDNLAATRRGLSGIEFTSGQYPDPWGSADLSVESVVNAIEKARALKNGFTSALSQITKSK